MNLEDFGQNIEAHTEDDFDENMSQKNEVDARRRLEDKIEQMRLAKEIEEFNFDF